jgi:hypothetical protein
MRQNLLCEFFQCAFQSNAFLADRVLEQIAHLGTRHAGIDPSVLEPTIDLGEKLCGSLRGAPQTLVR